MSTARANAYALRLVGVGALVVLTRLLTPSGTDKKITAAGVSDLPPPSEEQNTIAFAVRLRLDAPAARWGARHAAVD